MGSLRGWLLCTGWGAGFLDSCRDGFDYISRLCFRFKLRFGLRTRFRLRFGLRALGRGSCGLPLVGPDPFSQSCQG